MKYLLGLLIVWGVLACEPQTDPNADKLKSSDSPTEPAAEPEPTDDSGLEEDESGTIAVDPNAAKNAYPVALANVETVSDEMVPGSLQLPIASLNLTMFGLNPCLGKSGLFDCQPNLVKTYIGFSKIALLLAHALLKAVEAKVKVLEPGESGSLESDDTGEIDRIEYNIIAEDNFEVLLHSKTTNSSLLRLGVNGNQYTITSKLRGLGDGAVLDVAVTFTDKDSFAITQRLIGVDCISSDARTPERVVLYLKKHSGLLDGAAMIYMPRGLVETPSCSDQPTETSKVALYTQLVGNSANTTASIYLMPVTLDSLATKASYSVASFCTNFLGVCAAGKALSDTKSIADSYQSPLCVKTLSYTWGGACSDTNSAIATPEYSSDEALIAPKELLGVTFAVPDSLE